MVRYKGLQFRLEDQNFWCAECGNVQKRYVPSDKRITRDVSNNKLSKKQADVIPKLSTDVKCKECKFPIDYIVLIRNGEYLVRKISKNI